MVLLFPFPVLWRSSLLLLLLAVVSDPSKVEFKEGRRDTKMFRLDWYCYKMLSLFLNLNGDTFSNRNFLGFSRDHPSPVLGMSNM